MSTDYQRARVAIDERRGNEARIVGMGSQDRYLAQIAAQRAQAERERDAFWNAAQALADRQLVDETTLDLAVLYVERHGENVPPTLRWDQVPTYRIARARIRAARRG